MSSVGRLLVVLLVVGLGPGIALAGSTYDVEVSPAVPTPERTVSVGGESFTVHAVGRVDAGESLEVTVTAPEEDYEIYLLDGQGRPQTFERATGDTTVTFETDDLEVGSYLVSINEGSVRQAVHPVVVPAYDVAFEAPTTATTDESIEIEATLEAVTGDEPISSVTVAIGNDEQIRRVDMTRRDGSTYTASVSLDDLAAGEYSVTVGVRGTEEVRERDELIGMSDARTLTVSTADADGSTPVDGGMMPPGESPAGTTTGTSSASGTSSDTADGTNSPDTGGSTTEGTDGEDADPTASTTSSNVLTPNAPPTTQEVSAVQHWPDVPLLLVAIALLLLLRRR